MHLLISLLHLRLRPLSLRSDRFSHWEANSNLREIHFGAILSHKLQQSNPDHSSVQLQHREKNITKEALKVLNMQDYSIYMIQRNAGLRNPQRNLSGEFLFFFLNKGRHFCVEGEINLVTERCI